VYQSSNPSLPADVSNLFVSVSGGQSELTGASLSHDAAFESYALSLELSPPPNGKEVVTINLVDGSVVDQFNAPVRPLATNFSSTLDGVTTFSAQIQTGNEILVTFSRAVGQSLTGGQSYLSDAEFSVGKVPESGGVSMLSYSSRLGSGTPVGSQYIITPSMNGLATGAEILYVSIHQNDVIDSAGLIVPVPTNVSMVHLQQQTGFSVQAISSSSVRVQFSGIVTSQTGGDLTTTAFLPSVTGGRSVYLDAFSVTKCASPSDGSCWDLQFSMSGPADGNELVVVRILEGQVLDSGGVVVKNPSPFPYSKLIAATTYAAVLDAGNRYISLAFSRDVYSIDGGTPLLASFKVGFLEPQPNLTLSLVGVARGSSLAEVVLEISLTGVQLGTEQINVSLADGNSPIDSNGNAAQNPVDMPVFTLSPTPSISATFIPPPASSSIGPGIPVDTSETARFRLEFSQSVSPANG